jgi:hypothetical protein
MQPFQMAMRWTSTSPPSAIWRLPGASWSGAVNRHDVLEKIAIDKSSANTASIESVKADVSVDMLMRQ